MLSTNTASTAMNAVSFTVIAANARAKATSDRFTAPASRSRRNAYTAASDSTTASESLFTVLNCCRTMGMQATTTAADAATSDDAPSRRAIPTTSIAAMAR